MSGLSQRVRARVRPEIAELVPYDPDFAPCKVNLSANENSYGMPARVRQQMDGAGAFTQVNRYPDPMANGLRDQIADWRGTSRARVCVGNGGDELLFDLFLAFGGPGRRLVDCPPTFSVYDIYARMLGTEVLRCPRDPETFEVDLSALLELAPQADLVVVASPNNPTGTILPPADVARLCAACPGIVVLDEAYAEFADPGSSCEGLLASCDNLVVLHTFSKAYCLAGVRVGYVLAAPDVVDTLAAVRQPYTVDVLAQTAAQTVVSLRGEFEPDIEAIRCERSCLARSLGRLPGVRVWPSQGNFLLVRLPQAARVRALLRDRHSILVRDVTSVPGLQDCLRITVGRRDEDEVLLGALEAILREVA